MLRPKLVQFSQMLRRLSFALVALAALFFMQFSDCLSPLFADQQTMDCCGSMPCRPGQGTHECCKVTASAQPFTVLPVRRAALLVPHVAAAPALPRLDARVFKAHRPSRSEAPLDSPPHFYT